MAFDEAMAKYSSKEWLWSVDTVPQRGRVTADDVPDPLALTDFLRDFCRRTVQVKTAWMMLDVQRNCAEFGGLDQIAKGLEDNNLDVLPAHIRPKAPLPANTKVGLRVINHQDGTCDVVKTFLPDKSTPTSLLSKCVTGEAMVPQFRNGPWAVKKAFTASLERVLGYRVSWASVSKPPPLERQGSKTWCPPDEELIDGVQFINDGDCPDDDGANEQTVWILRHIRDGSGSPIEGWPEVRVRRMVENKSKGLQGAEPQFFWPLSVMSFKAPLKDLLLPLLLPLMLNFGVLLLGWPGVGKTPLFISMLLALGRYHIDHLGLDVRASWRRGKTFDAFKYRGPQIQEGLFLDDPDAPNIDVEDWKSWLDRTVDGTVKCRYHDAKMMKNAGTGVALNEVDAADEPPADDRAQITPDECLKLARKPFMGTKPAHILACLKRSILFVFGKNALYIRLPSKNDNAICHRLCDHEVHLDVLAKRDRTSYNKYLNNVHEPPATFDDDLKDELDMFKRGVAKKEQFDTTEDYIGYCNEEINKKVDHSTHPCVAVTTAQPRASKHPCDRGRLSHPSAAIATAIFNQTI